MGLMDSAKKLAKNKDKLLKNKDKIAQGVDKATDFVDKKTGGKYADKLKKVDDAASKFAGQKADDAATATAPEATSHPTPEPERES